MVGGVFQEDLLQYLKETKTTGRDVTFLQDRGPKHNAKGVVKNEKVLQWSRERLNPVANL